MYREILSNVVYIQGKSLCFYLHLILFCGASQNNKIIAIRTLGRRAVSIFIKQNCSIHRMKGKLIKIIYSNSHHIHAYTNRLTHLLCILQQYMDFVHIVPEEHLPVLYRTIIQVSSRQMPLFQLH